jgi:hypothetical protein
MKKNKTEYPLLLVPSAHHPQKLTMSVIARVRPLLPHENAHAVTLRTCNSDAKIHLSVSNQADKVFSFKKVLAQDSTQRDVFREC